MVIELSRASTVSWLVTHSLPGSRDRRRRSILRAGRARHGAGARYRGRPARDRKSTRLNSSHVAISYAVFCLKKKKKKYKKSEVHLTNDHTRHTTTIVSKQ